MQVNARTMAAAYEFLSEFEPFRDLPPVNEIQFKVTRCNIDRGYYHAGGGSKEYLIAVSSKIVTHMDSLLKVMAHEMLHLHQEVTETETEDVLHNKAFWSLGHKFCHEMGWDPGLF